MKKAISLLTAVATAASLGLTAFAASDVPGTANGGLQTAAETRAATAAAAATVSVAQGELFLVDRENNRVAGFYEQLTPGEEYSFEIRWAKDAAITDADPAAAGTIDSGVKLTAADLDGGSLRIRTVSGSDAVQSARINQSGRGDQATYTLDIVTREAYGTEMGEVDYTLAVTGGNAQDTIKESSHAFTIGWPTIDDADTDVKAGGYITINNNRPVITEKQFDEIAKNAGYKAINFEGEEGDWLYTGNVSGMKSSNFHYTYDVVPEIINKFPDQDYKFLTFNAGVTFPTAGQMRIDVSGLAEQDDEAELFTYLYRGGKLTRINAEHDADENVVTFRTNYLGAFMITNKEITDTTIVEDTTDTNNNTNANPETNNGVTGNPGTGAASVMDMAALGGVAALAAAGVIARRKK